MAQKSIGEIIKSQLAEGKPLAPQAVAELREAGREDLLKANAANILRCIYEGKRVTKAQMAEVRAYFPDKVKTAAKPNASATKEMDTGCPLDNPAHERFAQLVAKGISQADAYRECYPHSKTWKPSSVWESASKLCAKVAPRVEHLQQCAAKETVLTRAAFERHLMEAFVECRQEGDINNMAKVGALITKVKGWEAPSKVEVKDGGVTDDYVPRSVRDMDTEELARIVGFTSPTNE